MNREQLLDLWLRFRAGEPLSAEEDRDLRSAFESDPGLREEILGDLCAEGTLQAAGGNPTDADDFIRGFFNRLEAEGDGTRFLKKVESRMGEAQEPSSSTPPTRRTRRAIRRSGSTPGMPPWMFGLVAAGVLAAVVLVLAVSSDRKSGRAPDEAARVRAASQERPRTPEPAPTEVQRPREVTPPAPPKPAPPPDEEALRKAEQERRAEIERNLKAAVEAAKKEPPAPPKPPPQEPTPPPPPPKQETVATAAPAVTLLYAEGDVVVMERDTRTAARSGQAILRGQGLITPESAGVAVLLYPDGTRLSLGPGTEIREIVDRSGKPGAGKRIGLVRGRLEADVARQPLDQPMLIATAGAEVKVLGTTLRVIVDPRQPRVTRLEVEEGKVQLRRLPDLKTVDVPSGHFAVAAAGAELVSRPIAEVPLPFDRSCPVIYTNNTPNDCYTDEYLMALASAGDLKLRGIISGSDQDVEAVAALRVNLVAAARRSGMRHIPDPVNGPAQRFEPPPSGKIEDTRPWGSVGGRLIVAESKRASSKKPLLILSGGPLGAVADAYLLDPSIADRVVLIFHGGEFEPEAWNRSWDAYIALDRMKTVLCGKLNEPSKVPVSPARLEKLPEGPLRDAMRAKGAAAEYSSLGIIGMMRTDFFRKAKRKSLMPWPAEGTPLTMLDDPKGRLLLISEADRTVAAEEFWRALEKPAAWGPPK